MALLDVLHRLASRWQWRIVVAHFNHQLRGAESDGDERLVGRVAKRLGLEFVVERWPRADQKRAKKTGLEMAARLARHDFFGRVAEERKIGTIALAHHAGDQAELFFLRLFRGAGGEGLGGMKCDGVSIASRSQLYPMRLVRPLLDLRKDDLLRYAKERGIRFRQDSSNALLRHERNRVRRELLPLLQRKFDPAVVTTVVRAMDLVGTDAEYVRGEAGRWLTARRRTKFDQLHPAVQRQCLRIQLERLSVTPNYELVEHLRLCPKLAMTAAPHCDLFRDDAGWIVRKEEPAAAFSPNEVSLDLSVGKAGREFDGVRVAWRFEKSNHKGAKAPGPVTSASSIGHSTLHRGQERFDAAKVGPWVKLRHWRAGDRFQPIGMERPVKLQDLFTNLKVPRPLRHELIVATTSGGEIWWVQGVRMGERFKLDATTRQCLIWNWEKGRGRP
jgi:tRNA(Ile)-lysidine synthase